MININWTSFILYIIIISTSLSANAQIGYQVALINNATGEPRAMETVNVDISITDNNGTTIYSESQSATTNDFGIISLSVGNSETFKDMDWSKLPLFISAKVDGILLGRTQILNVPVAEYAKRTGVLTIEKLCKDPFSRRYKHTMGIYEDKFSFLPNGTGTHYHTFTYNSGGTEQNVLNFHWYMDNNTIIVIMDDEKGRGYEIRYIPQLEQLYVSDDDGMILAN